MSSRHPSGSLIILRLASSTKAGPSAAKGRWNARTPAKHLSWKSFPRQSFGRPLERPVHAWRYCLVSLPLPPPQPPKSSKPSSSEALERIDAATDSVSEAMSTDEGFGPNGVAVWADNGRLR